MIKVLFAIDEFPAPVAGTETQFWRLLNGLDQKVVKTGVVLLRRSEYLETHKPSLPTRVMNVTRLASPLSLVKALLTAIWARKNGYQLAHTFLNDTSILLPWAMKLVGIPVIVSRRDEGFWYTPGILRALRVNRRFVAGVVANSRAVADAVAVSEGYPGKKLHVIHNGIDVDETYPVKEQARDALRIPEGVFVFSILANLRPLKRIDDVIRAFSSVYRKNKQVQLIVAGEDRRGRESESHCSELQLLSENLGVAGSIRFLGSLDDTNEFIGASDVGLLCSETEGLSNSLMQYMLAGKPVVATAVGGNKELVVHERTGLLVNLGDIEGITSSMLTLLTDGRIRKDMGTQGKHRIVEHFSMENMLSSQIALYRELAG